ncbi:MAG: hypothetical protein KDB79_13015 [Acidobacteria bacterium]|nr:hypothetical protein [Acidobacteriota bacterium]
MRFRYHKIFFILFGLILSGCGYNVAGRIEESVLSKCNAQKPCIIELKSVTPFSWDEMYFFDNALLSQEVNTILKQHIFSSPNESSHKMVFFMNGKIIYKEEQITDIEKAFDGEIYFEIDQSKKYGKFTHEAAFDVAKRESSEGTQYDLKCVNCE